MGVSDDCCASPSVSIIEVGVNMLVSSIAMKNYVLRRLW